MSHSTILIAKFQSSERALSLEGGLLSDREPIQTNVASIGQNSPLGGRMTAGISTMLSCWNGTMDLMSTNIGRLCASSDSSFNMFWHQRLRWYIIGLANNTTWVIIAKLHKFTPFLIFYRKHFDSKVCCLRKDAEKTVSWRPRLRLLDWSP